MRNGPTASASLRVGTTIVRARAGVGARGVTVCRGDRYKSGEGIVSRPAPAVRAWQHVAEIADPLAEQLGFGEAELYRTESAESKPPPRCNGLGTWLVLWK